MFDTSTLERDFGDGQINDLARQVADVLKQRSFYIREPITLRNYGSGPAIDIQQNGLSQHKLISASDSDGRFLQLGFGAASRGITANEFVPDTNYSLDPTLINEVFSTQGNAPHEADRSLLTEGRSGTGIPHTRKPYVPVAGWGDALAGLQKSNDTEHAPDSAIKLTRDGNQYWWVTEPWKWQVVRCTVTAINADTLTCNVVANGKVIAESITVAKPCYLQQTGWDGQTVGGVTYTYSDSQHRTAATDPYTSTSEVVYPLYATDGPCPHIYAHWVGNKTGLSGVYWLDLNVDARHWIEA